MPVDSVQKRMVVGHVKRPGRGVFPGTTGTVLGRAAAAWTYATAAPAPVPASGSGNIGIGQKKAFSDEVILGGGGSW